MKYQHGLIQAHKVMKLIQPYCRKLEIVGALRRRCPEVNSIELLAISREEEITDLFGEVVQPYFLTEDWVHTCDLNFLKNGPKYKRFFWQDSWVNLYLTSKYQWGLHMAIRTGCRQYSRWLVTPKRKGGALPGYMRVKDGWLWSHERQMITLTEPNFYNCIEAEWIRPELRTAKVWG